MFDIEKTCIEGCFILTPFNFQDSRGSFIKIFHKDFYYKNNLRTDFTEEYFSISKPNVFRGMHFQLPPKDHAKLVTCIEGSVLDIIIDLRKNSSTFKNITTIDLNDTNRKILYLPSGIAHGFFVNSNKNAIMLYNVTSEFSKEHDSGINYECIKHLLPKFDKTIISTKDSSLPLLLNFKSPF